MRDYGVITGFGITLGRTAVAIGYKTAWIAVRGSSPEVVADVLGLGTVEQMAWEEGTNLAYRKGVYVGGPVSGWVLAHGRGLTLDGEHDEFSGRLAALSAVLGEVQFFGTHRVVDYCAWAQAHDGRVLRAYCISDGMVHHFHGEPTQVERDLGKATLPYPDGTPTEHEWEVWWRTVPGEQDVMRVAGGWSVDPTQIEDVVHPGLYAPAPGPWTDPAPARR